MIVKTTQRVRRIAQFEPDPQTGLSRYVRTILAIDVAIPGKKLPWRVVIGVERPESHA